jgi:hypothetical protein
MKQFGPEYSDKISKGSTTSLFLQLSGDSLSIIVKKILADRVWMIFYLLLQDINLAKNFLAEIEFHKIDSWSPRASEPGEE